MDREAMWEDLKTYVVTQARNAKSINPLELLKIIDDLEEEYE